MIIAGANSCSDNKKNNNTEDEIFNTIKQEINIEIKNDTTEKEIYQILSPNNKKIYSTDIDSLEINTNKEIQNVYIDSIKNSPLFMRGTRRHIWEFLWYNQYKDIIKKYNDWEILNDTTFQKNPSILRFQNICFPLIVDWLEKELPNTIKDVLADSIFSEYKDSIVDNDDLIIITNIWKNWQDRFVLWYYIQGNLYLATEVSIWRWEFTPAWVFSSWMKYPRNKSRKYQNAAMPYTIQIQWNICMHQWKVTWKKLSHGCIRVPWLFQQEIYKKITDKTPIIINKNPKTDTQKNFE